MDDTHSTVDSLATAATTTNTATSLGNGSSASASVGATIKKGLLWQQRDKLFSRWKERYFILTKDYFHCFKRASSKMTEMGGFIFKVKCFNCS